MRLALAILVVVTWSTAFAQPEDFRKVAATNAASLFEEGRALVKDGKWTQACDRFTQSLELVPAVGTKLNLAACLEHEGHLRRAWQLYRDVAVESERAGTDSRTKLARERLAAIETELAIVILEVADPSNVAITIGGAPVAAAANIREIVDPGNVDITLTAPGRTRFAQTIRATRGGVITLAIPAPGALDRGTARSSRAYLYVATGIAAIGVASGVQAAVGATSALRARERCSPGAGTYICDTADHDDIGSGLTTARTYGVASLVLIGIAATVYFAGPNEPATRVKIVPAATTGGGGVVVTGSF